VDFKGKAKAFVRTYGFLASILPFGNPAWEKLSIFLTFLIPKLPAPREDDLSRGILEAIDMDSYRVEVRSAMAIGLADQDAEIEPVPTSGGGHAAKPVEPPANLLRREPGVQPGADGGVEALAPALEQVPGELPGEPRAPEARLETPVARGRGEFGERYEDHERDARLGVSARAGDVGVLGIDEGQLVLAIGGVEPQGVAGLEAKRVPLVAQLLVGREARHPPRRAAPVVTRTVTTPASPPGSPGRRRGC